MSVAMVFMAGQPEYVGVMVTVICSPSTRTAAHNAQVQDAEHRHFGVGHFLQQLPDAVASAGLGSALVGYHVRPGYVRCMYCSSVRI